MIKLIACIGENYELGVDNRMPWSLKGDLEYFKKVTLGHTIVMGSNTYRSIGRALRGRRNVVVTHGEIDDENVEVVNDVRKVFDIKEDVFIIGGRSLYDFFMPYADEIYLTEIKASYEADVFFPHFKMSEYDEETVGQMNEDGVEYSFHVYRRRNLRK